MIFILLLLILIFQITSYVILVKKFTDYFNPVLFTFFFIFFPFVLSHLNLSVYQHNEYHYYVYLIMLFSSFGILLLAFLINILKSDHIQKKLEVKNSHLKVFNIVAILSVVFPITYLYENYMISGHWFSLLTIEVTGDTHLEGIPILREINTILRVLLPIMNIYMFLETKKKRYLFLCLVSILVPLSRGSRSTFFNSFLIILTLIFRKISLKKILAIVTVILTLVISGISLGNYRRIYTTREYGFEVGIFSDFFNNNVLGNIFSWYYGYYSLSFYNLSTSINNWVQNPNHFLGLTNLNGLLAYFFNNYPSQSDFNYSIVNINGAANVPTAFYYYIVDFGILGASIFDFIFYSILFYFYRKSINDSFYRLVYCLLLFNVLNFVFYSSFYAVYLYPIILFLIAFKFLYIRKKEDNTVANFSFNDNI